MCTEMDLDTDIPSDASSTDLWATLISAHYRQISKSHSSSTLTESDFRSLTDRFRNVN
jgi:hypothetical protein